MSTVLAKNRKQSSLSFYTNLATIRNMADTYLGNQKRYKNKTSYYNYAVEIIKSLGEVTKYIDMANAIVPANEHEVMIRRDFQNMAIGCCNFVMDELNRLYLREDWTSLVKGNDMRKMIDALNHEISSLKWWRKQNNSLMNKFREKKPVQKIESKPVADTNKKQNNNNSSNNTTTNDNNISKEEASKDQQQNKLNINLSGNLNAVAQLAIPDYDEYSDYINELELEMDFNARLMAGLAATSYPIIRDGQVGYSPIYFDSPIEFI